MEAEIAGFPFSIHFVLGKMNMRKERLELSRFAPYASETYAYTNSATSAGF